MEIDLPKVDGFNFDLLSQEARDILDQVTIVEDKMDAHNCHELLEKPQDDLKIMTDEEEEIFKICQQLGREEEDLDIKLRESGAYDHFRFSDGEDDFDNMDEDHVWDPEEAPPSWNGEDKEEL